MWDLLALVAHKQNHHRGLSLTWEWLYASNRDTKVICNAGKAHPWVLLTKVSTHPCLCWQGVSCQGVYRTSVLLLHCLSHPVCHPAQASHVSTGQPGLSLASDLLVPKGVCHSAKIIPLKRLLGTKSPNYSLFPAAVWVRRSCLEDRMTENLTEEKLGIHVFGNPSGVQGRLGCGRKRANIEETLSTRKTKTAPRKLWQDC